MASPAPSEEERRLLREYRLISVPSRRPSLSPATSSVASGTNNRSATPIEIKPSKNTLITSPSDANLKDNSSNSSISSSGSSSSTGGGDRSSSSDNDGKTTSTAPPTTTNDGAAIEASLNNGVSLSRNSPNPKNKESESLNHQQEHIESQTQTPTAPTLQHSHGHHHHHHHHHHKHHGGHHHHSHSSNHRRHKSNTPTHELSSDDLNRMLELVSELGYLKLVSPKSIQQKTTAMYKTSVDSKTLTNGIKKALVDGQNQLNGTNDGRAIGFTNAIGSDNNLYINPTASCVPHVFEKVDYIKKISIRRKAFKKLRKAKCH